MPYSENGVLKPLKPCPEPKEGDQMVTARFGNHEIVTSVARIRELRTGRKTGAGVGHVPSPHGWAADNEY